MLHLNARETNLPVPYFPLLKESAPRRGFVEHENFKKLFAELPARLRAFVLFLYTTGCRTGEAKKLRWNQIDWKERVVRVEEAQTKNAAPRTIPLYEGVVKLLKAIPKSDRKEVIFPVGCFRKAWQNACVRAGLGTLTKGPTNGGGCGDGRLTPHPPPPAPLLPTPHAS